MRSTLCGELAEVMVKSATFHSISTLVREILTSFTYKTGGIDDT
jgi:hypothetical protein